MRITLTVLHSRGLGDFRKRDSSLLYGWRHVHVHAHSLTRNTDAAHAYEHTHMDLSNVYSLISVNMVSDV